MYNLYGMLQKGMYNYLIKPKCFPEEADWEEINL